MATYVVNPTDAASPTDAQGSKQGAEELRALKARTNAMGAGAIVVSAASANPADVVTFIQPDINDRPAMVAGGWLPWNLNQQWGGAGSIPFHLIDSATGTEYKFDAFDQYIDTTDSSAMGDAAARHYLYQVITPAKNIGLQAIWFKISKNAGNPVDNIIVKLWSVAAGIPNAVIATANVVNGKQIVNDTFGQWVRFSFAVVQNLIANTQYICTLEKSGGVDAGNNYVVQRKFTVSRYPNNLSGTGTVVPAWTAANTTSYAFIAEAQASDQPIQSAGTFAGRIIGSEGTPINRSVAWNKPLKDFMPLFNTNGWSILIRGKTWTKDRTIFDAVYGIHHDRINVRSQAATGFTVVTVYEQDGTVNTITGTSDISGAAYKDIMIVGRTMNDGGDYIKIYVGVGGVWTKEVEALAQTYTLDPLMLKQGNAWIMGGWQLFSNANYTKLSEMTILPSADGWTFTTTSATPEGNAFAVSNGKLNQIKSGYAAAGDGYYRKDVIGLSNANGWFASSKLRIGSATGTNLTGSIWFMIQDGAKQWGQLMQEHYTEQYNGAATQGYVQADLKNTDNTLFMAGKGSDALVFLNGKLLFDATGKMTNASANNRMEFGDNSTGANENADVTWDHVGYYNTANIYPQFTSGELHEFAVFSGDKNLLGATLYNLGVPFSTKQYCGIARNYIEKLEQTYIQRGVVVNPTTGTAAFVLLPDMELFGLGTEFLTEFCARLTQSNATQYTGLNICMDGVGGSSGGQNYPEVYSTVAGGSVPDNASVLDRRKLNFGLHKIEGRWGAQNPTSTAVSGRIFTTEIKV